MGRNNEAEAPPTAASLAPNHDIMPWASISGPGTTGAITWLDNDPAQAPHLAFETAPQVGLRFWLTQCLDVYPLLPNLFWCLWEPAAAMLNGWDESNIFEIDQVRLVLGRARSRVQNDGTGSVEVEAIKTVPLCDMKSGLASPESAWRAVAELNLKQCFACRHEDYVYVRYDLQSDIGSWGILIGNDLVAFGQWSRHEDTFWSGRVPLTRDAHADLQQALARTAATLAKGVPAQAT